MTSNLKFNEVILVVRDIERAKIFYEELFQTKCEHSYKDRWVIPGKNIFLYNPEYDAKNNIPTTITTKNMKFGNNSIVCFQTNNINEEYERVRLIEGVSEFSEIMELNMVALYRFFNFKDSEGNYLEIGEYPNGL